MASLPLPLVLAIALGTGAIAGAGLERAGVLSPLAEPEAEPATVQLDRVAVLNCPDGVPVATLARGDRILATGRSDDGAWIEIRSPVAPATPAWMAAGTLDGERPLDDLPTRECERAAPSTTSSTSSTSTSSTSSTSTTSTTAPARTTTTIASDRVPPVITVEPPNPQEIFENSQSASEPPSCGPNSSPAVTTIRAVVADDASGVLAVEMTVEGSGVARQPLETTSQGSTFEAVLGPFPAQTVPAGDIVTLTVTVTAEDRAGNTAVATADVQLRDCSFG